MEPPFALQRSATLPGRRASTGRYSLGSHELSSSPSSASEEILYYSPSAKIFKFELPNSSSSEPILPDLDYPVDAIETLPWKLSTERIASIGSLRIENVAGSATFLKSGSVVYPLLKNSQCWCVDKVSRFVFRIRKLTYYRVELPGETEEDISRVESFKEVLSSIIRYEITPCPFKRGFSVVLPEEAKTPKKKKAWQPKRQSMPAFLPLNLVAEDSAATGGLESTSESGGDGAAVDLGEGTLNDEPLDKGIENDLPVVTGEEPLSLGTGGMRSDSRRVTAPPQTFQSLVAKFQEFQDASDSERPAYGEDNGRMSSFGSYHTCETEASISPLDTQYLDPPSSWNSSPTEERTAAPSLINDEETTLNPIMLPDSDPFIDSDSSVGEIPEDTSSVEQRCPLEPSSSSMYEPSHLSPNEDYVGRSTAVDDPDPDLRQRLRINRKRDLSPLPPSSTLYYPSARSPANHLTHSILQKTCTYVLGPPVQFLMLLLRLAARVAVNRQSSDSGNLSSYQQEVDELSEDDFGIPIPSVPSMRRVNSNSLSAYDSLDEAD
ncbi:uncharacterized protein GIQ15_06908 [Arthroderma uncinatum]|uniref:uncharacterized protein n=1 Tax=Arthroderma uncinatum TaxID=74035 RepID=UPI00144AAB69|nr:uncharacterized protein GIQ15_06908 [Arthroderma uncinatum]KAF3479932.1 hypothetical protein GIQ15_06908 [Arthroderma uncinatum]